MVIFVMILGFLIAAAGVYGLAAPSRMAALAGGMQFSEGLRYLAAYGRMLIGIVLFFAAYQTKFSVVIQVLAMFSVFAGVFVLVVRRETIQAWMERVPAWPPGALRAIGAFALALGALLVYAAT